MLAEFDDDAQGYAIDVVQVRIGVMAAAMAEQLVSYKAAVSRAGVFGVRFHGRSHRGR